MMTTLKTTTMSKVATPSGVIAYREEGSPDLPVALFVHGVLLNGHLWRHQLAELSDIRRCIAVDLLTHGDTELASPGTQDVSVTANARMLLEFLDAMKITQVDLVGNDSGGGIAQIFAANYPELVRTLTLTNCDASDNWPPEAFKPFLEMAAGSEAALRGALEGMLADKNVYRAALAPAYEGIIADEDIEVYLRPLLAKLPDFRRFLGAFDCKHTLAVDGGLRKFPAPTLIVWGTDDVYFPVRWSEWLAAAIPNVRKRVEFEGARIFFVEERWREFNTELRAFWGK
jgi:pimeloyl-ACP methyl ester carboxylesterase